MQKTVLGISAFYHDSAAALVRGGEIIAAAQEERFSRKKHDPRFPRRAINYCLEEAFIEPEELEAIVFYDNPILTFDRVVKNCLAAGARGREQFMKACPSILGIKLWVQDYVRRELGSLGRAGRLLFTGHHFAHAASAFYPSPFREAAIVTLDGVGEWSTTTVGLGRDSQLELLYEIDYPHSLGLLYSAFTYFCGFKVNSGEYKLMGLAPYGEPKYYQLIREKLVDVKEDGSYRLNTAYFGYLDSMSMTNDSFAGLFGGPPRRPETRITRREMDLAASVQRVTEEIILGMARFAKKETSCDNLVLAGGVALNCVANGKIIKERVFGKNVWIQPAAGDAGGSLGAALLVSHRYFGTERPYNPRGRDLQKGSYLGPSFSDNEIAAFLERHRYPHERVAGPEERAAAVARALAEGKIVGYFAGRMEFGPRALGARSILGDPRRRETQSVMNLKIKYRESFRPFAPSVLAEDAADYFDLNMESPYMLLVAGVKEERTLPVDLGPFHETGDMLALVNEPRSDIPAVTHVDYSARIQTVHREDKPDYYLLIRAFKELTGCSVVVNTSFNVRGEPIVCTPQDAYRCFMRTEMDLLVLEDFLLWKERQPAWKESGRWREEFELD